MPGEGSDPERGRAAALKLRELGVRGILVAAAEQGYITQLACKMPECYCPEELGGACYFEPVMSELTDWTPTHEHFPRPKREGGHRDLDNSVLAHRLATGLTTPRASADHMRRIWQGCKQPVRKPSGEVTA